MWGLSRKLREIAIGIGAFVAIVAVGVIDQVGAKAEWIGALICGALIVLIVLATAPAQRTRSRRTWFESKPPRPQRVHPFTVVTRAGEQPQSAPNAPSTTITRAPEAAPAPVSEPERVILIKRPYVIDGDTIDDNATRIRFRLENIDAPETKENAKCAAEAHMGGRAKWKAIEFIKAAKTVEAHTTGRIDPYGRMIARVKLDGEDLGDMLVARGFARPWTGARETWCGGALNDLTRKCYGRPICIDCAQHTQ